MNKFEDNSFGIRHSMTTILIKQQAKDIQYGVQTKVNQNEPVDPLISVLKLRNHHRKISRYFKRVTLWLGYITIVNF